jgi:predicted acetyltransferase
MSGSSFEYDRAWESDCAELHGLLAQALHFPTSVVTLEDFYQRMPLDTFRVVRAGSRIAAGLRFIDMGVWLGGVSVRCAGIAAVGAAPEFRSQGAASQLLAEMLREIRNDGFPLSLLFPATLPVYRRAGYERSGVRIGYTMPSRELSINDRRLELVPAEEADREAIHQIYHERARRTSGNLDRTPFFWNRVFNPRGKPAYSYLIQGDAGPEGYIVYTQGGQQEAIEVVDYAALTPAAGRRILTFLRDDRSMTPTITWYGGPADLLAGLCEEQIAKVSNSLDWMVRIVNVESALTARPYPPSVSGELGIEVRDEALPGNSGRYVVAVEGGRADVSRGGNGALAISDRGLAALYTGHRTAEELRSLGLADGDDPALALASAIFSGPKPWMSEIF